MAETIEEKEIKPYVFFTNSGFMAKVLYFQFKANLVDWKPDKENKERTVFVFKFETKEEASAYRNKAIAQMKSYRKKQNEVSKIEEAISEDAE